MNETFAIQNSSTSTFIDALEKFILDELPPAIEELEHVHTPGLYGRKWSAKAGTIWVTRQHKVEHQFVVLKGAVVVWKDDDFVELLTNLYNNKILIDGKDEYYEEGHNGITKPGTRRVLYVDEDAVWMTFHPNPENLNENEMVELVTEKHDNSLFSEEDEKLLVSIRSKIEQKYLTT